MAASDPGRTDLPRVKGRLRPVNAVGPIAGSAFAVLAWAAIAHNSGSGWVQALGIMLGSVLLVGIFAPALVVARTGVAVHAAPADGVAGEPLDLEMVATTRVRLRPVAPGGKAGFAGPCTRHPADSGTPSGQKRQPAEVLIEGTPQVPATLQVVPPRRGMLYKIEVDIASAAPFGLLWWSRRATLELPAEVCVAPKPADPLWLPPENDDSRGESQSRRPSTFGETRGARPYQHGDSKRAVNWRASAHTGHLMVREMEVPTADPITVRVVLPADPDDADRLAERAFATVLALIGRQQMVMLATHEPAGDRVALVTGARDAGRRLARAVPYGSGELSGHGPDQGPSAGSVTIEEPTRAGDAQSPPTVRSTQVRDR